MRKLTLWISILSILLAISVFAETKVYFSPNGGCTDAIVKQISQAQKNIDVAMYAFSSRSIAQELVKAKERGVVIRILLDKAQETQKYSKSRYFINKGIDVRYDTGIGLMHNKVGIIDGKILITGSFNWTAQAEIKNAENLLIMDDPELIKKYSERFEFLWNKGRSPSS